MLLPRLPGRTLAARAASSRRAAPMPPRAASPDAAVPPVVTVCAASEAELDAARAVLGTDPLATGPSTPAATLAYAPSTHPAGDAAPFFAVLTTRRLGRVLLTAPALPSTQALLQSAAGRAPPGAVAAAATQTAGKGRGANAWTSPEGCLAASLSTRCDVPGTRLPFVQYVVSLAVLAAARAELVAAVEDGARGEEGAAAAAAAVDAARAAASEIRIKWPNDVYMGGAKLAGVLCHSCWADGGFRVTAGIGMNVANAAPPFAALADAAAAAGGDRARAALSPRRALAVLCNTLEPALDTLMSDGFTKDLSDQYHAAWLHSGQRVTIDGGGDSVVIERLSDAGFLRGVADDGQTVELHPDANSLDLFQGLVRRK